MSANSEFVFPSDDNDDEEDNLPARGLRPNRPEDNSLERYDGLRGGGEIRSDVWPIRDEWISAREEGLLDLREWR